MVGVVCAIFRKKIITVAKSRKPTHVSKPTYPGGAKALTKFVNEHVSYPDLARREAVEGTVVVRYSLDYRGRVVDAKVKRGIGSGCDEEALRVVRLLRFNVPQNRKKKVRIHQDINVHFKLPKKNSGRVTGKVTPTREGVRLTYTTNPQKPAVQIGTRKTYGYTITW